MRRCSDRSAIAIQKELIVEPPSARYSGLADVYSWLGDAYLRLKQIDDSVANHTLALETFEDGLKHFPDDIALLRETARKHWYFSSFWQGQHRYSESVESLQAAARIGRQPLSWIRSALSCTGS